MKFLRTAGRWIAARFAPRWTSSAFIDAVYLSHWQEHRYAYSLVARLERTCGERPRMMVHSRGESPEEYEQSVQMLEAQARAILQN